MFGNTKKQPDPQKELSNKMAFLTMAIERTYPNMKHLAWRSFYSGIFTGLGATVGLALVLLLLGFIINLLGGVPFLHDIIVKSNLDNLVQTNKK